MVSSVSCSIALHSVQLNPPNYTRGWYNFFPSLELLYQGGINLIQCFLTSGGAKENGWCIFFSSLALQGVALV